MSTPATQAPSATQYDVAIIGAGFSGSLLAVHLAAAAERIHIALIERGRSFGPGLAYGASSPEHLLNVPAGKMGAYPDKPDHFLRWLHGNLETVSAFGIQELQAGSFLPRPLYGRYLASLIQEAAAKNDRLHLTQAEVTDIIPLPEGGYQLPFADGGSLRAARVVLAWGNFPPSAPPEADSRILRNPWSVQAREALSQPGDILILGSGLTSLDLLATAHRMGREGRVHVLSRHGRFPQGHRATPSYGPFLKSDHLPRTVRLLFKQVRREIGKAALENVDWRAVIDSLRPFTQKLWLGLPPEERRRFLRHVKPLWEIIRHRAAPELREIIQDFDERSLLQRHRGRLISITQHDDAVHVTYRPRGSEATVTLSVQAVINATGPESDLRRIDSPLLQNLLHRGLVKGDPLRLGVEVVTHSAQADDPLHTLGSLRKGALWESTAVPELREQAATLAQHIIAQNPHRPMDASDSLHAADELDHLWLFQI